MSFFSDETINKKAFYNQNVGENHFFPQKKISRFPTSIKEHKQDEFIHYRVKKHDTYMIIAQKVYGDFSRWREIRGQNNHRGRYLIPGTMLTLKKPVNDVDHFLSKGLPYIIQRGDSLSSISYDKYGTSKKWVKIYQNNRNIIKSPHKIYAGFTIYYETEPKLSANF